MREIFTLQNLLLILPFFVIVYSLVLFCIVKILREGVANLSKGIWITIVGVFNVFGVIGYLSFGRRRDL